MTLRIGLIGFGEAGQAFVEGWAAEGTAASFAAFDIKTDGAQAEARRKWADYARCNVAGKHDARELCGASDLVFSLVTADQATAAAASLAGHLAAGTLVLDGNSCAPETKRANAALIAAAGGRYVDMAIMAPVDPGRHKVPVLLSGEHAGDAASALAALGMNASVVQGGIGAASSIKMLRSVVIKGLEALLAECVLAARRAGVETAVLDSLARSDPGFDWAGKAAYNLERMMVHGPRRAAEMRESARTVRDLGLSGAMAAATAEWQELVGGLGLVTTAADGLSERADAILGAMGTGALEARHGT